MLYMLDKIKAIEELEQLKGKKELRTFLGMTTYMSSFIPKLANYTAPLCELLIEFCLEFITR